MYKIISEHMGTSEKHTPQLSVTGYFNVRFADKNCKSLLKMLMHTFAFCMTLELSCLSKFQAVPIFQLRIIF